MRFAIVAALALVAAGCGARTAYTADHSRSWTCVPNPTVRAAPLGEPLAVTDAKGAAVAAK